ncbi:MAG: hypothetical protein ACI9F9_002870 [Candidatus Paceibacteria bacterium]|jgi:hypothetical protein
MDRLCGWRAWFDSLEEAAGIKFEGDAGLKGHLAPKKWRAP